MNAAFCGLQASRSIQKLTTVTKDDPSFFVARTFTLLKRLGVAALFGVPLFVLAFILPPSGDDPFNVWLFVVAFVFVLPALFYFHFVVIWHWKARYRGKRSDLWGALLLIETSGWMKLVYLFRHLLPDAGGTGRYATSPLSVPPSDSGM